MQDKLKPCIVCGYTVAGLLFFMPSEIPSVRMSNSYPETISETVFELHSCMGPEV
jgi:hypothetical protein